MKQKLYVQAKNRNEIELSKIRHDGTNGDPYALYLAKNYLDGSLIEIGIPVDYEEAVLV